MIARLAPIFACSLLASEGHSLLLLMVGDLDTGLVMPWLPPRASSLITVPKNLSKKYLIREKHKNNNATLLT
jgi:hypothetical protein